MRCQAPFANGGLQGSEAKGSVVSCWGNRLRLSFTKPCSTLESQINARNFRHGLYCKACEIGAVKSAMIDKKTRERVDDDGDDYG